MTVQEWDDYVGQGWYGIDSPHPEYDALCVEACVMDDEALRALARSWAERHRQAAIDPAYAHEPAYLAGHRTCLALPAEPRHD